MSFNMNDFIGFAGVTMLLVAFLLNLTGKLDKDNISYILLNLVGAGLACLASYLIRYYPFVLLEGAWTLVSGYAFIKYFKSEEGATQR